MPPYVNIVLLAFAVLCFFNAAFFWSSAPAGPAPTTWQSRISFGWLGMFFLALALLFGQRL